MSTIEVFADVCCPFTHVGLRRIVAARRARGVEGVRLVCRAWPLEWVNGAPLDADHVAREVTALREQVAPGLLRGFSAARFPSTSIPALALAAAAYRLGAERGEMVSLLLRDELFERGRDIADDAVLASVAARAGVEPASPAEREALVRVDYDAGRARGVLGSPHFFVGGEGWFCPSLHIEQRDGVFHVTEDPVAAERILAAVLDAGAHTPE
ncbi:MAG: disulfide bond formation protein DsbA [Actinobacteria bacterium]|nr:disulfide bond formation protein DsbA [Actinomycetota bacterium]